MTPETPREAERRLDANEETELRQIAAVWRQEPTVAVDSGYAGLALQRLFATLDALRAAAPATGLPALPRHAGIKPGECGYQCPWSEASHANYNAGHDFVRAAADRAERGLPLDVERLTQVLDRYPMWWEVKRPGGKLVMTKMVGTAEAAAADIAAEYARLAADPQSPTGEGS